MSLDQITLIATFIESIGIITFFGYLIRGLRKEIGSLKNIITYQDEAMKFMKGSLENINTLGEFYRTILGDLPKQFEQQKNFISMLKDEQIADLEKANQRKDEKLKALAEAKLKEIEISEKMINELPQIILQVSEQVDTMHAKIKSIMSIAARSSTPPTEFTIKV